ncbi:phosphotransferase enzyme family protein [Ferruginibacter sp.]|nr:aminoglycoside phosphotransferase family protein [Ferruginibacter sp.]
MIAAVLQNYGIDENECIIQPFGSGLINNTWDVKRNEEHYILQRINHTIFKQPEDIDENITAIDEYLKKNYPGYLFVASIKTKAAKSIFKTGDGYFRLFPFVKDSHTIDVATNPAQAFEAAKQFGAFTKKLSGFKAAQLKITLPDFHNLTLRYRQFENALLTGNAVRIAASETAIALLQKHKTIADDFEKIKQDTGFKIRVTHHDTKISNVLFDEKDRGLCVIDLDTVMPGYFISDVGDMMRTYLSPVSEEEKDFSKIEIRQEYLDAIINGYLSEMENELTGKEKKAFLYAGKFMIYMQALRFLIDHLNNDVYYGAKYDGHNFVRGKNQLVLLEKLIEIE